MNLYDEISRVAYEIWLKKGMPVGCDMENWLEAEQIVYSTLRQSNESGEESLTSSVTTVASVQEPDAEGKVDNAQTTPATEPTMAPVKKRRGPYKKRASVAANPEKKVVRGRKASKEKSPEKKGRRGRRKKAETSEEG